MPKINQPGRKQYETPQITPEALATPTYGDMAPTMQDIIKSANARGQSRHEMKRNEVADVDVLPDSAMMVRNEMVGVRDNGYLAKKGLMYGVNAMYNTLPPGSDIEDQELCDIREMRMSSYEGGLGYPGDGWVVRGEGSQMPNTKDMGRPEMTNKIGGAKI